MAAYTLEFTEDARAFLNRAGDFLESDPLLHTVVTTNASRAARDGPADAPPPDHPRWWVSVVAVDGTVVGAAMRTAPFRPHPLYVLPMPDDAATALGAALAQRGEAGAGANGTLPSARLVAEAAAQAAGGTVVVGRHSRLWELGELRLPAPMPPGRPRIASPDDLDLAVAWFSDFHPAADRQAGREPGPGEPFDRSDVERRVLEDRVWLWEDADGVPVSLVGCNAPAFGAARVGPVYTPEPQRGRGYASALTAVVSGSLRDAGARVCLFTDQANPTSNKVYAAIGYEPVVDTCDHAVELVTRAAPA